MNLDIWRILKIEKTTDIKEIKRAYAARSKEYHPEEYPEEFKQLQNAYKAAMQYAKSGKEQRVILQEDVSLSPATQPEKIVVTNEYREPPQVKTESYDFDEIGTDTAEEKFWTKLQYLLWHPFVRKECDFWDYFLNQPDVRNLMQSAEFQERFLTRLKRENFIWDSNVLNFLDNYLENVRDSESRMKNQIVSRSLKPKFLQDILGRTKKLNDTDAEKNLYQVLWWNREYAERKEPGKYLKLYFAYAEENKDRLQEIHREAHAVRRGRPTIRITVFFIVFIIGRFILFIDSVIDEQNDTGNTIEHMLEQSEMLDTHYDALLQQEEERMAELLELVEEVAPSLRDEPEMLEHINRMQIEDKEILTTLLIDMEKKLKEKDEEGLSENQEVEK